jgi:hypothetical protein
MCYGMVLDWGGDGMLDSVRLHSTDNKRVVRLGAAGSKNDFAGRAVEESSSGRIL